MPDNPVVIPGWAVKVAGGFGALAIPWAAWVTMTLATMSVKMDYSNQADAKLVKLSSDFYEHVADPKLHRAGIAKLESDLGHLADRLDKLETPRN